MGGSLDRLILRLERLIDLPDTLRSADYIRARMILITTLAFFGLSLINIVGMYWVFGGPNIQMALHGVTALGLLTFIPVLRFTQNPKIFGTLCVLVAPAAVLASALVHHPASPGLYAVGTPYLPYLLVSVVFVALIGTRTAAIAYIGVSVAAMIGLFLLASRLPDAAPFVQANKLRLVLGCTALVLTGLVMVPVSQAIYTALNNLEAAFMRAREAENAKASFLSTMSHEIRTPLNGILGMSDMLARAELPAAEARYANLIQTSANSLIDIVNEVLDLARMEDGRLEIATAPFDLNGLLQDTADLFTARADEKSLWIGAHIEEDVPLHLIGDAPHLRQILNNLTSNAIKFTPSGGIRIGAQSLNTDDDHAIIQFYVQDSGDGISPEDQTKIFDRFSQTETGKRSAIKGTGLGLAICQELVTAMGGELRVRSEVGQGAIFYFTLRLAIPNKSDLILAA